ncbi:MAG: hypothetical protein MHM6MM_008967, partial [Cercozoa sp. M6MM]
MASPASPVDPRILELIKGTLTVRVLRGRSWSDKKGKCFLKVRVFGGQKRHKAQTAAVAPSGGDIEWKTDNVFEFKNIAVNEIIYLSAKQKHNFGRNAAIGKSEVPISQQCPPGLPKGSDFVSPPTWFTLSEQAGPNGSTTARTDTAEVQLVCEFRFNNSEKLLQEFNQHQLSAMTRTTDAKRRMSMSLSMSPAPAAQTRKNLFVAQSPQRLDFGSAGEATPEKAADEQSEKPGEQSPPPDVAVEQEKEAEAAAEPSKTATLSSELIENRTLDRVPANSPVQVGRLVLTLQSATGLAAMDKGGTSDPYVKVRLCDADGVRHKKQTKV